MMFQQPQEVIAQQDTITLAQHISVDELVLPCRMIAKTELHLHLGGAWPLEFLKDIATEEQFNKLSRFLDRIEQGIDYHDVFAVFGLVNQIVDTEEKVEQGVAALCEWLVKDNVTYAEIRTTLKDFGNGFEGYLQAVLRGIKQASLPNAAIKLILSVRRNTKAEDAQETVNLVKKYQAQGVVGLDISGDSVCGDGSAIFPIIKQAREEGIPLTLHLGESPRELAQQQMKELKELTPQRVGHGAHLSSEAYDWVVDHKVPVEMCLTSAVKVKMIEKMSDHPALKLLKQGHPVIVCTDNPLIFKTSLSRECAALMTIIQCDKDYITALQKKAIKSLLEAAL